MEHNTVRYAFFFNKITIHDRVVGGFKIRNLRVLVKCNVIRRY